MSKIKLFLYRIGLGAFLAGYHVALLVGIPVFLLKVGAPSLGIVLTTLILFILTGLAITAGYHRYFSHRSFKTNPIVETILLFFGTLAIQGSALRWSFEHRIHHAYVDSDKDPYSIKRGFWYAHFLWLFDPPAEIDKKLVRDLYQNKRVMFQYRHYGLLAILSNAIVILLAGYFFHSYLAAFLFVGLLRMGMLHHFTWFINSLAHTWGSQTFSREHTAADNYVISMVTFGEGYHNYHHTFCSDYRNGIKWYNFDPTKWLIWGLSKLGLATDLKRTKTYIMRKKQIQYDTQYLLKKARKAFDHEQISLKISSASKQLLEHLTRLSDAHAMYERMKNNLKDTACTQTLQNLHQDFMTLKKGFDQKWGAWLKLSKQVVQTPVLATK